MTEEASKMLYEVKELAQNACAGYALRVTLPYGKVEGRPISETDISCIVIETDLALSRLSEAIQKIAEFIAVHSDDDFCAKL